MGVADMDDTLVLTGEADARAYGDVMDLAQRLHEQVRILSNAAPPPWLKQCRL